MKPSLDSNGQPIITELSSTAKENLYADYGTTAGSNVAIVPPRIESKILGGITISQIIQGKPKSLEIIF